ncbi:uncharacterized protein LOC101239796 isoform X2 [Hydra vulgaris]|uniref:Uncharacterized protein LOC101239796 isoform X2 n=1 Tax=Hydra vulgaris TaxID=6087 RepID=A0ABM4CXB8_HYDVU
MDIWTIYLVLDLKGLQELINFINAVHNKTKNTNYGNIQIRHTAVVFSPSFLKQNDIGEINIPSDFFVWVNDKEILSVAQNLTQLMSVGSPDSISEDSDEFIGDCINHLADQIPFPGSCFVELYLITSKLNNESFPLYVLSSLKRLEIWNHACFYILSNLQQKEEERFRHWLDHIDFHYINEAEMISIHLRHLVWQGNISVKLKQNTMHVEMGYYYIKGLEDTKFKNENIFMDNSQEDQQLLLDTCLHLVMLIEQCDIPFHYVIPEKFHLCNLDSTKDPIDLLTPKGCWWIGILKYDYVGKNKVKTTHDWEQFLLQDFTQYLACEPMKLSKHAVVLITHESNSSILYFLHQKHAINSEGYLELLNMSQENIPFSFNNADEWCEKLSWDAEENISKVSRSISRCKSDDFFMNGVAISIPDTLKQGVKRNAVVELLDMFDENGNLKKSCKLQSIPVISDCLLKNIKSEDYVKGLPFDEAKHLIAHGIEYCLDTFSSIRLDSRLTKVQKRYVPDDTINLSSFIPTKLSSSSDKIVDKDEQFTSLKTVTNFCNEKGKETRSQRHKRRLKILVEGVVQKYGHMSKDHKKYTLCCKTLFQETLNEVKNLKSSKGLNEQMKQIAKNLLDQILIREGCKNDKT